MSQYQKIKNAIMWGPATWEFLHILAAKVDNSIFLLIKEMK